MIATNHNSILWIAAAGVLLLLAMVSFAQLPGSTMVWRELQNAMHIPFFTVITLLVYIVVRAATDRLRTGLMRQLVLTAVLVIVFAGLTELMQILTGRNPSMLDWLRDSAGVLVALALIALFDPRSRMHWRQPWHIGQSVLVLALLLMLGFTLSAFLKTAVASWQREQAFPVVVDFLADWSPVFLATQHAQVDTADRSQAGMAHIILQPGSYPGVEMIELSPDWSDYSSLSFTVRYEPADPAAPALQYLVLRVQDKHHNQQFNDRYNQRLRIHPGVNRFIISLQAIKQAPAERQMNMQHIVALTLFAHHLQQPADFYLSPMKLLR